jgi:hypothetical protein
MKEFLCRFCNNNYTRKDNLTRHLKENRCTIAKNMSPLDFHNIINQIEKEKEQKFMVSFVSKNTSPGGILVYRVQKKVFTQSVIVINFKYLL